MTEDFADEEESSFFGADPFPQGPTGDWSVRSTAVEEERHPIDRVPRRALMQSNVLASGGKRAIESAKEELAVTLGLSIAGHLLQPFRTSELETLLKQNARRESLDPPQNNPASEIDDRELLTAINRKEFILHYQPQIDIANGSVAGLVAYVRWNHPQRGVLFPDGFFGRIKSMGMIEELGWQIAERGLSEIGKFSAGSNETLRLTLRVMPESLNDMRFRDIFAALAKANSIPAHKIAFEVSAGGAFTQMTSVMHSLARLRTKGVQLVVDDYGSEGMGIQQLRQISVTDLKISRKVVQGIPSSEHDRIMVRKLILIAHELDMKAIAEGVETEQELEFLCLKGCDYAQGYFFCHPLNPESMADWLRTYSPWHCKCC